MAHFSNLFSSNASKFGLFLTPRGPEGTTKENSLTKPELGVHNGQRYCQDTLVILICP